MKIAVTAGFSLALLAPVLTAGDGDKVIPTTLSTVRATPDAFRNLHVSFTVQFVSLGRVSNPFFTQFEPSQYANFHVWADEQPIWRRPAYDDVFGLLFLSKNHDQINELYDLRLYKRLRVTGIVRNTFQDMPWIEVVEFEQIGGQVTTASLAHLYRGEQLMEKRQWTAAIAELSQAPTAEAPETLQAAVHKNLGICYLRIGESGAALSHLTSAAGLLGDQVDRETALLLATASAAPERELDRVTNTRSVKDHERPMWEAFDDGRAARPQR
jgi:hypothetical protein